jgi:hypothetical protein
MNQRIRALAKKANIEFTYDPTETPVRAFVECWEDDLEKFVDMIVKECIAQCESQNTVITTDLGPVELGEISDAVEQIKRHFYGVAE